ncbi:MAG TPA: polysaccharide biosynthesis tyrosine autokinase, partial [Rhodobacterales bacterium]|nr:polysaccharide biosynthesis tyrosine autokinase [Rhodobacterales bacterium]
DKAMASPGTVAPKRSRIVAMALILGLLAGSGFALVRSYMSRGVRSTEEIEALDLSVYGTIPKTNAASAPDKRGSHLEVLAAKHPTDLAVESLRSLRTSLHFGMLDAKNKLCTITSSRPGEGKSFISVNLATVLAKGGQKTCLIDADMRRGYLHRYFGLRRKEAGLSTYLAGDVSIEEIIHHDEATGLSFIATGDYPPNPAELLMHERFRELCDYLNKEFDIAVFDTPPVLAVTDPIIIGKATGMTMLVARAEVVMADQIRAALKKFDANGFRPTGVIFNGDDPKTKGYTNYQYHYEYKSR